MDETINTSPGLAEIEKLPSAALTVNRLESLTDIVAPSTNKLSALRMTPEILFWQKAQLLQKIRMNDKKSALMVRVILMCALIIMN